MAKTKQERELEAKVADVMETLESQPAKWLACRDLRHAWDDHSDWYIYKIHGVRTLHIARDLECLRCETLRREVYKETKWGLEKVSSHYVYPEHYLIKGVPKGVKTKHLVDEIQHTRVLARLAELRVLNDTDVEEKE